jgi:hypothetical protein
MIYTISLNVYLKSSKLSTTDLLVLASMKNAAKCDKYCELQDFVNHRIFERTLHLLVFRRVYLFERHLYTQNFVLVVGTYLA